MAAAIFRTRVIGVQPPALLEGQPIRAGSQRADIKIGIKGNLLHRSRSLLPAEDIHRPGPVREEVNSFPSQQGKVSEAFS